MSGISMVNLKMAVVAVLVAGTFLLAAPGPASAQNVFVKISGIPGESQDALHRDWIDALGYFDAITASGTTGGSAPGGRSVGRTTFSNVKLLKSIDKASPLLRRYAAEAGVLKEVKIEITRETGDLEKFLEITLENVTVSQITGAVSKLGDDAQETVTLSFSKIHYTYTEYDSSGKPKGTVTFGWNIAADKRI